MYRSRSRGRGHAWGRARGLVRRRSSGGCHLALALGSLDARGTPRGHRCAETLILEHRMVEVHWSCAAVAACIITEGVLRRTLIHRRRLGQHTFNELLLLLQERPGLVVLEIAVQ